MQLFYIQKEGGQNNNKIASTTMHFKQGEGRMLTNSI